MPYHKSAEKRLKTAAKANLRNKSIRSAIKTMVKKVREAKNKDEAGALAPRLFSMLDTAARKRAGGMNKNKAANTKRKLQKSISALAA